MHRNFKLNNMVRHPKKGEISYQAEYMRKKSQSDPIQYEKQNQKQRDYYQKNKERFKLTKKLKSKEQREIAIKHMGGKCMNCEEQYNPHAKKSNLEFDHKVYISSKSTKSETFRQVLDFIDRGEDPKIQFALLCHTCHMIVTHLRIDSKKSKDVLEYIKSNEIFK